MTSRKKALFFLAVVGGCAGVAGIVGAGCEPALPASDSLTQPRVLAIRSTPVELVPGGEVTLDALVYTPSGSPAPTYQWSWCATVDATFTCTSTAAALTALLEGDAGSAPLDLDLGTAAQATFAFPAVTAAAIQAACPRRGNVGDAGDAGDDGGDDDEGDEGGAADDGGTSFEAGALLATTDGGTTTITCDSSSWTVYVLVTITVGDVTLRGVRELSVDFTAPTSVNTNPTVVGLQPFAGQLVDAGALADPGDQADGAVVEPSIGTYDGGAYALSASVPLSASDTYATAVSSDGGIDLNGGGSGVTLCSADAGDDDSGDDDSGDDDSGDAMDADADTSDDGGDAEAAPSTGACTASAEVDEALTLAWYAGGGSFSAATTSLPAALSGSARAWSSLLVNHWTPPATPGSYPIIVVIRDSRGGVGWWTQTATVPIP